jgi:hypothetical protein
VLSHDDPTLDDDIEAERQKARAARMASSAPNGYAPSRFKFAQFREILLGTAPAYVVDKMIPRLGVVVVWGAPKCGKTFWVFDLEMHIAAGWSYRGRRVEQGAVLHIACEGVAGLAARKEAWRLKRLAEVADDSELLFYLCNDAALDLIGDIDKLIADIRTQFGDDFQVRVITIDTLNRSLVGSESRDEDMAAYLRAAVALAAEFQCACIIIHHCGYDATHPRGHTSLRGGCDGEIEVKKDSEGRVCTVVKNMRDGPEGAQTRSRLEVVEVGFDDNGEPITSCVIEPDDEGLPDTAPATPTRKRPVLPASAKTALKLFNDALARGEGRPPPGLTHIPSNVTTLNEDLWRRYCYQGQVSEKNTPEARQKAFVRAEERLLADGIIGKWGEFVWLNPSKEK